MKFEATHDYVFVKQDEQAEKIGSLFIPTTAQGDAMKQGRVVYAGPGKFMEGAFIETTVHPGDRVLFSGYPREITIEENKLLMIRDEDVMGIYRS